MSITFEELVAMLNQALEARRPLPVVTPAELPAPSAPNQDELIVTMAASYQLPEDIVRAMVLHESVGGITHAIRFEPTFYDKYIKGREMNYCPEHCSHETERIGRATSWGLMQVMGETARCNGFRGWFPELCTPVVGLEWGCRYLRRLADKHLAEGGWPTVMRAYNGGPGNKDNLASPYPDKILALIPGNVWPE
ncbi:lytic transglycosylase domain-containing protein [Desulfovibrio sulfodismutans]|uniref:Lytic transglycosylase domain-containing protein n=1 Tax=Desulfolutivibrio sulfodismutans TaxID=63561 RepID=A0A7K3NM86_9BACT|nr:transglycosylase SLT domain-containing protein [Desulfolutivibrio sulfodismutans]NDY56319.1 lytic transglycosylase domain-containing protein [Desulfolutivibrio sulfodismutans]QLA11504.1 transglycosylase SLT domain-containing protein [Desulfolutivibrio sulfodismutans DSM 3696]QLA14196.1 transglycosylase SLT domain-containing protein [Desulfolutivibrio sulfodismutans DSM 3696]